MAIRLQSPPPWSDWFWDPEPGLVRRAVGIAVMWAYVAAFGVLVLGAIAGLVLVASSGILYLANFGERTFVLRDVLDPLRYVALFVIPLGFGAAVWAAAFGSTRSGSFARAVFATAIGLLVGLLFHLLDFSGALLAALATGWAVALPADHVGRWGVRGGIGVLLAVFSPRWEGLTLTNGVVLLVLTPIVAGVIVWLADYVWFGINSMRVRSEPAVVARSTSTMEPFDDDRIRRRPDDDDA